MGPKGGDGGFGNGDVGGEDGQLGKAALVQAFHQLSQSGALRAPPGTRRSGHPRDARFCPPREQSPVGQGQCATDPGFLALGMWLV